MTYTDTQSRSQAQQKDTDLIELTAEVISAYVSKNTVVASELPNLIDRTFAALQQVEAKAAKPVGESLNPAVPIKKSVTADRIICLECGKTFKSLKRHLNSHHDLTPDQYRQRWGLMPDYPMAAPKYAARRSAMAKQHGFGRKTRKT